MIVSRFLLFYFIMGVVHEWCLAAADERATNLSWLVNFMRWFVGKVNKTSLVKTATHVGLFHAMKM